jgi:hypothetical protein
MTLVPHTIEDRRAWLDLSNPALELANQIAGTDFVPKQLQNNPAAITAAILYGDEVGLGPMQSLAKIAVINGRPTLAAEAQRALILAAGHDLWVEESTATKCTVAGRRKDSDATSRMTWTMDDARRAGLANKPPWKMYPRQMLMARASAELARAVFPDAIGGLAATEELDEEHESVNGTSAATPAPEPTAKRTRKRANVTAPATTPDTPAPKAPEAPPVPGDLESIVAPDAEEMITENQRRKLHAMFREKNMDDREERLSYCGQVVGHPVRTSTSLTQSEASIVIDALDRYDPQDPQTWPFPQGF